MLQINYKTTTFEMVFNASAKQNWFLIHLQNKTK